tara:strand:- start:340 stop:675 length:336 start_codon:yes stop_codon:yes gene_type:complete
MNDAVKLMKRSALIVALADGWKYFHVEKTSPDPSFRIEIKNTNEGKTVQIKPDHLLDALRTITGNSDQEWLEEKAFQIWVSGLPAFMDYLDLESLAILTNPSINLFPLAGV